MTMNLCISLTGDVDNVAGYQLLSLDLLYSTVALTYHLRHLRLVLFQRFNSTFRIAFLNRHPSTYPSVTAAAFLLPW